MALGRPARRQVALLFSVVCNTYDLCPVEGSESVGGWSPQVWASIRSMDQNQ
jgi:hypothetical protein